MTHGSREVELDRRLADLLGVPALVAKDALASRVARLAGFPEPTTPTLVGFWVAVATCIDEQLARKAIEVMDDGEAAHYVKMCVLHKLGGMEGLQQVLDTVGERNLDETLEPWLVRDMVQGMAARGAFRLAGRPVWPPPH